MHSAGERSSSVLPCWLQRSVGHSVAIVSDAAEDLWGDAWTPHMEFTPTRL